MKRDYGVDDFQAKVQNIDAENNPILNVAEVARILGVSPKSVYALIKQPHSTFPAFKVGKRILISYELLLRWIENECEKPSA